MLKEKLSWLSENGYQVLLNRLQDGIFAIEDGRLIYVNQRLADMLGVVGEKLIGRPFIELVAPRDRYVVLERHQARLAGREVSEHYDMRLLAAQGEEILCSLNVGLGENKAGGTVTVGSVRDVTLQRAEQAELEKSRAYLEEQNHQLDIQIIERDAALRSSQELLEKVQRLQDNMVQSEKMAALGGLVAGIAHEINTPVGIILMSSTHLEAETTKTLTRYQQGELSGDELESYFDIASQSAHLITLNSQRAADLIHSFKQVAVDQSSGKRREFKLKGYIDEILLSLQPTLKKTQISVTLECPEGLTVNNYPGALSQVLTNFIMNSLLHAYQADQTGKLNIRVRPVPDDQVEIIYSDDGQGIPPELQSRIFEPFYTTRRGNGGSGLGLHIVYNIVRQTLHGQLHTHSVVGQGTTFTITFPRVAKDSVEEVSVL